MAHLTKKQQFMYRFAPVIYGASMLLAFLAILIRGHAEISLALHIALLGFSVTGVLRWRKDCDKANDHVSDEGRAARRAGLPISSNPYHILYIKAWWDASWKWQRTDEISRSVAKNLGSIDHISQEKSCICAW